MQIPRAAAPYWGPDAVREEVNAHLVAHDAANPIAPALGPAADTSDRRFYIDGCHLTRDGYYLRALEALEALRRCE